MSEISCPHCHKAFKVDQTGYAHILKQVRDKAFDKQLDERLQLAEKDKASAIALAKEKLSRELQSEALEKEAAIQALKTRIQQVNSDKENASKLAEIEKNQLLQEVSMHKDKEIQEIQSQLAA